MSEIWKEVGGTDGRYEVSTLGRVKSFRKKQPRILKPQTTWNGYLYVTLTTVTRRHRYIHALVLEAFVGPRPRGFQCCHNDGVRTNNHIENLRWGTPRENAHDRIAHGTTLLGEESYNAKLTEEAVAQIRHMRRAGLSYRAISLRARISTSEVVHVCKRNTWRHVPDDRKPEIDPLASKPRLDTERQLSSNCRGERRWNAKLTEDDVYRIRELRLSGLTYNAIAAETGMSATHVCRICLNRFWRHLPAERVGR